MPTDDRDILDILKLELEFLEKGGYGRSVRTPWEPTLVFTDSPSCFGFPNRVHDDCCRLMQFVPAEHQSEVLPCHHIPLDESGETIARLEERGDQERLEEAVGAWLRATIKRIEEARASGQGGHSP